MTFDPAALRAQFPGLEGLARGKRFAYLDTAATAQKPLAVIESMDRFLRGSYGTVHRGLYERSVASTAAYEDARTSVAGFLGAKRDEVVFTMGCTDAINLVAWSWGLSQLKPGDRLLISGLEHHAGLVPWQLVAGRTGAVIEAIPVQDDGSLDLVAYDALLAKGRVRYVGVTHIANSVGTVNPVAEISRRARAAGAKCLVDAAQSAPHRAIDVKVIGCDWLVFGAHKIYGPTGIGVLWGRPDVLESMPPWRGGGEMIERVSFAGTTFAKPPARFEAGTPPIVEAIGLAAAVRWLSAIGWDALAQHERSLLDRAEAGLAEVPGLRRIGTAPERSGVISFVLDCCHPADLAAVLDNEGVAIRAGHHCAQPVMDRFGVPATARISVGCYTDVRDIDQAIAGIHKAVKLFR